MAKTQRKHKRIMRDRRKFKPDNIGKSYTVGTKDWKSKFNKDIERKIKASEIEYKNYKDTGSLIFLQQAGEKLFSAVENYLMVKYDRLYKSHQKIRNIISNNELDAMLFADADILHTFFYNADLLIDRYDADIKYRTVLRRIKQRL